LLCLNGNISGLSQIGQTGQLGTVPKWGKKRGGQMPPSTGDFSEDALNGTKTTVH
jgi:hypothetical protein